MLQIQFDQGVVLTQLAGAFPKETEEAAKADAVLLARGRWTEMGSFAAWRKARKRPARHPQKPWGFTPICAHSISGRTGSASRLAGRDAERRFFQCCAHWRRVFRRANGYREENGERTAFNTMVYSETEIRRIAKVAFETAQKRKKRVCSIDKSNVLESMRFWRDCRRCCQVLPRRHVKPSLRR